jgi:hypothetical protein
VIPQNLVEYRRPLTGGQPMVHKKRT